MSHLNTGIKLGRLLEKREQAAKRCLQLLKNPKQEDWMRDITRIKMKLEHWKELNTETQEQLKSLYPNGYV